MAMPMLPPIEILNKLIEVNIFVGCMVWPYCCLFQLELPVKLLIIFQFFVCFNFRPTVFGKPVCKAA